MLETKRQVIKKELPKENRLTLLLQSIFDSETILTELVTNGQEKASILEEAKQQINLLNLQEKVLFLEGIFTILANPNSAYQDQNKRDAALDVLRVMDLTTINSLDLAKTYRENVEGLDKDSDPLGEIDALLEAGIIIAPFIDKNNTSHIRRAWKKVISYFPEDDQQIILQGIKKMQERYGQRKLR